MPHSLHSWIMGLSHAPWKLPAVTMQKHSNEISALRNSCPECVKSMPVMSLVQLMMKIINRFYPLQMTRRVSHTSQTLTMTSESLLTYSLVLLHSWWTINMDDNYSRFPQSMSEIWTASVSTNGRQKGRSTGSLPYSTKSPWHKWVLCMRPHKLFFFS